MKIRPLTMLALAVLVVVGVLYFADKRTSSKHTTVAPEQIKPSPTPQQRPNRALKTNEKFIAPIGLYITVPEEMNFREETADDPSRPIIGGFYIEKEGASGYQFYGVYSANNNTADSLEKAKKEMERRQDPEVVEARVEEFQALATKIFQKLGVVDFDLKFVKDNKEAYGHLPDGSYLIVSTYGGKAGNYGPGKEVKKALSDFPVSVNDFQPGGPGHQYEVYITLSLSK